MWWSTGYTGSPLDKNSPLSKLRDRLLGIGGCEAVLPVCEPDAARLLEHGQLWDDTEIILRKRDMRRSQCHSNSSLLWLDNRSKWEKKGPMVLCTGYALTKDGFWRQHSWLVKVGARSLKVIETTVPRIAYFGFGFTYEESEDFSYANI